MKHAILYYYTATGNTRRAFRIIADKLEKSGWTNESAEMPLSMPSPAGDGMLIVGFPALGFSAPSTVLKNLRALPRVGGVPAAVICLVGSEPGKKEIVRGWAGAATHVAMRILRQKGYLPAGTAEISYPANWTQFMGAANPRELEAMVAAGDAEASDAGDALARNALGTVKRNIAAHSIIRFIGFMFRNFARMVLARLFIADASCDGCGLCARCCPSASIRMVRRKPAWTISCSACNRCINICPRASIQTSTARLALIAGINLAALLAAWPVCAGLAAAAVADPAGAQGNPAAAALTGGLALAAYILFTLLQVGPLDGLLRLLERAPGFRRAFAASFTAKFRRYSAPGFIPPVIRQHRREGPR